MRFLRELRSSQFYLGLFIFVGGVVVWKAPAPAEEPKKIDFVHDIVPILRARCSACHTNGKYKGSFSLDTREVILKKKAIIPGKSNASELFQRISSKDPQERMPPQGPPLSAKEIALLRVWIDQGLPWEPGFTFKRETYVAPLKPRRPVLPSARAGREHPIDRILDAYYAQHQVAPPAPLDDVAFFRRVYLDVIGLLPAPAELEAGLKDSAPNKRERLLHRLLNEKRAYTEHWLSFWNDLLRNDYAGTGYVDGGRKQITAWLYRSLLENKPYDRFVRELINPTGECEGFIKGITWRGSANASQSTELQFSQNVAQVFFGANMKCASCHDSYIDAWKLEDAYGLAAVVANRPLEMHRCDKPTGRCASPRFLFPELGSIDATQPRSKRLEQLARLTTHLDNGRFTRTIVNRIWQRLMGRALVQPVDIMANRPFSEDLLDYLSVYLTDQGYDLKKLIAHVITSQAYQSKAVMQQQELLAEPNLFRGPEIKHLTAEQLIDALRMITRAGTAEAAAGVALPEFIGSVPAERRFIRASLALADPLMRSLGRPNREQVVTSRPDQLTILQAIDLSNGHILTDMLTRGAAHLLKQAPQATPDQHIKEIYLRSLCRLPTTEELVVARQLIGDPATKDGLADLLWAVIMLPEFQLIR